MPNKYLTAEPVENLSQSQFKTYDVSFSVPTSTDVAQLSDSLVSCASKVPSAKIKISVGEIGAAETKLSVKIEALAEEMENARSAVTERIFKSYKK